MGDISRGNTLKLPRLVTVRSPLAQDKTKEIQEVNKYEYRDARNAFEGL